MIFSARDEQYIRQRLAALPNTVKLVNFTQELECQYCSETRQLLNELARLSDKIKLEVYNFQLDREQVTRYGIDKIPATVIESDRDYGIRFYGIPAGYEFATLLDAIEMVSRGDSGLSASSLEVLQQLTEPVHIQVFVTPTCPYCPAAVRMAYQLALASEKIRADGVEVSEFPHLAVHYGVRGVPHTVINERYAFTGAVPEPTLLAHLVAATQTSHRH